MEGVRTSFIDLSKIYDGMQCLLTKPYKQCYNTEGLSELLSYFLACSEIPPSLPFRKLSVLNYLIGKHIDLEDLYIHLLRFS